jgi:hypothetical protein
MASNRSAPLTDEGKGLRRFELGAALGLAGGAVGLILPLTVNLLALHEAFDIFSFNATLVAFTWVFVLVGAVLLAISLILYRFGFSALRKFDRWFLAASILCNIGSIGLVLIVVSAAVALSSSPALATCIQGDPTHALSCLQAIQPFAAWSVIAGFWLAWLGGLGIVTGLVLGGRRYRQGRLIAGGALYALLLLVLIDPFVALLFPIGGWQYPLLTVPVLALAAPVFVYVGSRRSLADRAPRMSRRPRPRVGMRAAPAPSAVRPSSGAHRESLAVRDGRRLDSG